MSRNYPFTSSPPPNAIGPLIQWLAKLVRVEDKTVVSSFSNSWSNSGSPYPDVGYYKDPWGRVFLEGRAEGGTIDTTMFTLPEGYRPKGELHFEQEGNTGAAHVIIDTSGNVETDTGGGTAWVHLDGISFRAI